MSNYNDILITIKMLERGIIPSIYHRSDFSINRALSLMSISERRRVKRKFRKLWKKAIRLESTNKVHETNLRNSCGAGISEPDLKPYHRIYRAALVYRMLLKEVEQE